MSRFIFSVILVFAWFGVAEAWLRADEVADAVAARARLASEYHLSVVMTRRDVTSDGVAVDYDFLIEVWSKGTKRRTDVTTRVNSTGQVPLGSRQIACRNCERDGHLLATWQGRGGPLAMVEFHRFGPAADALDQFRLDWRYLGLLDGDMGAYKRGPADGTLTLFGKLAKEKSRSVTEGDISLIAQQVPMGHGDKFEAFFRPDQEMNPVRYVSVAAALHVEQETTVQYAQLPGGTWYPSRVTHLRSVRGKPIVRETVAVTKADFTSQVPDAMFTLVGLGLDSGQPVGFPEITSFAKYPIWRDGKLDRDYTFSQAAMDAYRAKFEETAPAAVSDAPAPTNRPLYLALAAVLGILGIVAFALARRARRP